MYVAYTDAEAHYFEHNLRSPKTSRVPFGTVRAFEEAGVAMGKMQDTIAGIKV